MGRAGRFACIFLPLCATAATAALIIIGVLIGQTNKSSSFSNSLYFLRVDTRNINTSGNIDLINGTNLDNIATNVAGINTQVGNAGALANLPDFYQAGFWSYCEGNFDNGTSSATVTKCSKPRWFFAFNLIDIINTDLGSGNNVTFPKAVVDAFKGVNALSKAQFFCFLVGFIATLVEFVVGWFGLLSRIGSCVTTLVANVAFMGLLAGGVINIILYKAMEVAFNGSYKQFGIRAQLHNRAYQLMFIGVALSLGAAIFWLFSSCCCSGKRDKIVKSRDGGEKGFGGKVGKYERVPSPYTTPLMNQSQQFQQQQHGTTSYEPMRHANV